MSWYWLALMWKLKFVEQSLKEEIHSFCCKNRFFNITKRFTIIIECRHKCFFFHLTFSHLFDDVYPDLINVNIQKILSLKWQINFPKRKPIKKTFFVLNLSKDVKHSVIKFIVNDFNFTWSLYSYFTWRFSVHLMKSFHILESFNELRAVM